MPAYHTPSASGRPPDRVMPVRRVVRELKRRSRDSEPDHDWWAALQEELRVGPWIDLEVVLRQLERQLGLLKDDAEDGDRFLATCLAKLRMALMEAQIQSAPEAYGISSDGVSRIDHFLSEAASDTMQYFDLFGRPGRDTEDLFQLNYDEYTEITEHVYPELALESCTDRSVIEVATARLATPPRMISLPEPAQGRRFSSGVLSPVNASAVGGAMPDDVMRHQWPVFQYYGQDLQAGNLSK